SGLTFAAAVDGQTLEIRNGTSTAITAAARWTATDLADGNLGMPLFLDADGSPFTNALGGQGQKLGFAARITINPKVVQDNTLLVKYDSGTAAGDSARVEYLVDQFKGMRFGSNTAVGANGGGFRMSGSLSDMVNQMV